MDISAKVSPYKRQSNPNYQCPSFLLSYFTRKLLNLSDNELTEIARPLVPCFLTSHIKLLSNMVSIFILHTQIRQEYSTTPTNPTVNNFKTCLQIMKAGGFFLLFVLH